MLNEDPITPNDGLGAVQDHPDQPSEATGILTWGARNEEMPEQLVNSLKAIFRGFQSEDKYLRRREVLKDWRNRLYERGIQHIYESGNSGVYAQGTAGAQVTVNNQQKQLPNYVDDYNITLPYCRAVTAVLTQQQPGFEFRADNPTLSEDMEAAESSEDYKKIFDRANDTKTIQRKIVRRLILSGRSVCWTRTEADSARWGINPKTGTARHKETASIYGVIESKVQISAKSLSALPYVILADDPAVISMKKEYPKFADKINTAKAALGENEYERMARLSVLQGQRKNSSGEALNHLTVRLNCWGRPSAFESDQLKDEALETDGNVTVKEALRQAFPDGCHVVFVGDTYVGSWNESIEQALDVQTPFDTDGMSGIAMVDPFIVVQDRTNDDMNAYAEVKDFGWPKTHLNAEQEEVDAINSQTSSPYTFLARKARNGMALEAEVFQEPQPEIPETLWQSTLYLITEFGQFLMSAPPALFGGEMADNKTAAGYSQARSQAMGVLGDLWEAVRKQMAAMYKQAAKFAAENPDYDNNIVVPGDGANSGQLKLEGISKGNFGVYPDDDSSLPESTAAKRQMMQQLFEASLAQPQMAEQLFGNPRNWELYIQTMGMTELHFQEADSYRKQVFEIEQLLGGSPMPDPDTAMAAMQQHATASIQSQAMGQPPPPPLPPPQSFLKSTVPVQWSDYDDYELKECLSWLSSEDCRRQIADGNTPGVENVRLHAKEHQMALAAKQPPPMPAMPPPSAPKPGKPDLKPPAANAPVNGPPPVGSLGQLSM